MQETQVPSLIWGDPTCHGATKPVLHNCWPCVLESGSHNYWSLWILEPLLNNKEEFAQREACGLQLDSSLCSLQLEKKTHVAMKTQHNLNK